MRHVSVPVPVIVGGACLAIVVGWPWGGELAAQRPVAAGDRTGPLWISDAPLEDGRRQLVVVDGETRHAAVYHVDPATGALTLRSARDISWDLMLDEFNGQEPRPATLRTMLQQTPGAAGSR